MKSVMESILKNCENAMLARKPIILLQTDELEIIHRIVASDRLLARVCRNADQTLGRQLYRDAEDMPPEQYLFRSNGHYQERLCNVFTYASLESFAEKISNNLKHYGWPLQDLEDSGHPTLFLIPANQGGEALSTKVRGGLFAYIDHYLAQRDDNAAVASSAVLIYGEKCQMPDYLQHYCALVEEPFPSREELVHLMERLLQAQKMPALPEDLARRIAGDLTGFRLLEAERLLEFCLRCPEEDGFSVIYNEAKLKKLIAEEKKQMLKKDQVLDLIEQKERQTAQTGELTGGDDSEIGGMETFKQWLSFQMPSIRESQRFAAETGGRPCKGVLMCGIPGCGKSMAAQEVAVQSRLPLLRLEIGKLLGKYVGDSEHNMNKALKQAEAMAPCVLWIDEIEKGFSSGSGDSGSDPTKRMFGSLLTWLQECRAPVFIFATANSITGMPKEFFRSGRFDALFSLYMPTFNECVDILKKQMERVQRSVRKSAGERLFEERTLSKDGVTKLFQAMQENGFRYVTGADLEKVVNMALQRLWTGRRISYPVPFDDWKKALQEALRETTVYGDGRENLDSIAVCYIRLLSSNFSAATDHPVFRTAHYMVDCTDEARPKIQIAELEAAERQKLSKYDLSLRELLAGRMKDLGVQVDLADRRKLIG